MVGCACAVYDDAKNKNPQKHPLGIFAFWDSELIVFGALLSSSGQGQCFVASLSSSGSNAGKLAGGSGSFGGRSVLFHEF